MELLSIKADMALVLYHPAESAPAVGGQLAVTEQYEIAGQPTGIIVQVISHELLDYQGLEAEVLQRVLEERASSTTAVIDLEEGVDSLKSLKVARCKIRKLIVNGRWVSWNGWVPSRSVAIEPVDSAETLTQIMPVPQVPLRPWVRLGDERVSFDGPRLDQVIAIVAAKGRGKSHCAKHVVMSLAAAGVPTGHSRY